MRNSVLCLLLWLQPAMCSGAWTFAELNYSPGNDIFDSGIAWRPQGDYALIVYNGASSDGLIRYEYPAGTLQAQAFAGKTLYRIAWAPDGSYALLTGGTRLYRYEHSAIGFGTMTEVSSIQKAAPADVVTFYDMVWDPAHPQNPAYITTNYQSGSSHFVRIYRYQQGLLPNDASYEFTGGTTYAYSWAYSPVSAAFQADGDYLVIAEKGYLEGFYVYDPDQSTFPKNPNGTMQSFTRTGSVGNADAIAMSSIPGNRVVLLKGNGIVQRAVQTGIPASFALSDAGGPSMTDYEGDIAFSYDGTRAVAVDGQIWTPYHQIGVFDAAGSGSTVNVTGITQRTIRIRVVAWHPAAPMGLMGGEDGWLIRFDTDTVPTPTPAASPTATQTPTPVFTPTATQTPTRTPTATAASTPTPAPVPASTATGTIVLVAAMSWLAVHLRRNRNNRASR